MPCPGLDPYDGIDVTDPEVMRKVAAVGPGGYRWSEWFDRLADVGIVGMTVTIFHANRRELSDDRHLVDVIGATTWEMMMYPGFRGNDT